MDLNSTRTAANTISPEVEKPKTYGDTLHDFFVENRSQFEPSGITPEGLAQKAYETHGATSGKDYDTWAKDVGLGDFVPRTQSRLAELKAKDEWDAAKPEDRGSLATFGTALGRGAMDFVSMAGGALSVLDGDPSSIDTDKNLLDTVGGKLTNWADTTREKSQALRMTKEEEANADAPGFFQGGGVRGLKNELLSGVESVTLSAGTAALGAGIGALAAPALGIGAGAAAIAGGVAALGGIFFGGTYDKEFTEQRDKIRKVNPNDSEQEIVGKTKALAAEKAGWEAGTEVLSDLVAGAIVLGTGGLGAPAAGAIKTGVKGLLKPGLKTFLKRTALGALATVPSESGTEMLSAAMQDKAMADAGLEHMGMKDAAISAFIPSLVPSIFFGVGGASIGKVRANKLLKDINSEDVEARAKAVNDIAAGINQNTKDKELATAWLRIANQHVIEGKPIDVNEDIAAFAAADTRASAAAEGNPIEPTLTPEEMAEIAPSVLQQPTPAPLSPAEDMLTDGVRTTPTDVLMGTDVVAPTPFNPSAQSSVIEQQRRAVENDFSDTENEDALTTAWSEAQGKGQAESDATATEMAEALAREDEAAGVSTQQTTATQHPSIPYDTVSFVGEGQPLARTSGESPVINFGDRIMTVRMINGVQVPFYLSTGHGGKKDVPSGKWYPFFGIGADGWINKTGGQEMTSYYGMEELRRAAEELDATIGDVRGDKTVPRVSKGGRHIDFLNTGFTPAENAHSTTPKIVRDNIENLRQRLSQNRTTQQTAAPSPRAEIERRILELNDEINSLAKGRGAGTKKRVAAMQQAKQEQRRLYDELMLMDQGGQSVDTSPQVTPEILASPQAVGNIPVEQAQQVQAADTAADLEYAKNFDAELVSRRAEIVKAEEMAKARVANLEKLGEKASPVQKQNLVTERRLLQDAQAELDAIDRAGASDMAAQAEARGVEEFAPASVSAPVEVKETPVPLNNAAPAERIETATTVKESLSVAPEQTEVSPKTRDEIKAQARAEMDAAESARFDAMVKDAARWRGAARKLAMEIGSDTKEQRSAALYFSKMTTKGDLDAYLMRKYGLAADEARNISNYLTARAIPDDMTATVEEFKDEPWAKEFSKPKEKPAPTQPSAPAFTLKPISDKAFVVTGDTRPIKDKLKAAGGRWMSKYTGWMFPERHRAKIEKLLGLVEPVRDDVLEQAKEKLLDGYKIEVEDKPTGKFYKMVAPDGKSLTYVSPSSSTLSQKHADQLITAMIEHFTGQRTTPDRDKEPATSMTSTDGEVRFDVTERKDGRFAVAAIDVDSEKVITDVRAYSTREAADRYARDEFERYEAANKPAPETGEGMDLPTAQKMLTDVINEIKEQGRVADDRLIEKRRNLERLVKELEAGQANTEQPEEKSESTGIDAVVDHFAKKLYSGAKYDSIVQARKEAAEVMGETVQGGTDMAKIVDEAIELAIVKTARRMIKEMRKSGATDLEIYQGLVALYAQQPNLGVRTSTSVAQQAYSTPVPIAFLASRLAGIGETTRVIEPTAGNGMLLIEANPRWTLANELNPDRAARLTSLGFDAKTMDATSFEFAGELMRTDAQAIVTNPPFGRVRDDAGEAKSWSVIGYDEKFETKELDHAIALSSLAFLRKDGKAVLIIGGKQGEGKNRALKYHAVAQRQFYKALFDNFKVVDHFTVDGKLYAKQGAGFPIDVIVIDGRGKTEGRKFPAAAPPRIYESFEALQELFNEKSVGPKVGVTGDDAGVSGGMDGDRGPVEPAGASGDANQGADTAGGRTGAGDQGLLGDAGKRGADRPVSGREGTGEGGAVRDLQPTGQAGTGKQTGRDDGSEKQGLSAQGNQADTGLVQADDAAGVGGRSGDDVSLEALMGEWDRQEEASKPKEQAPKETPKEKTASERMAESAASLNENLQAALDVFSKFGGLSVKVVKEGDPINQSLYEAIRPHLLAAYKDLKDMGLAGADLIREFVAKARAVFGAKSAQARPYFEKFAGEIVEMERKAAQKEEKPAPTKSEKKAEGGQSGTALQDAYGPRSKSTPMGTLVPKNMTAPLREALDRLEAERGNIDQYVAKELGYSQKELEEYFAGEQVDAIALAIHNIDKGAGFIIGDQTGIGKGRVNAAIMRYAKRKGAVPVFVTMKPDLYADMVRDLQDIGMQGFNPLPTNGGLTGDKAIPLPDGRTLRTAAAAKHSALLDAQGKKGVSGYDAVFTTYSQLQSVKGKDTARRAFIRQIAPNAIFILDESHNAGGAESSARKAKDAQPTTAEFVRDVLGMTDHGVFYSSATYAKRPDVMSLYFKTDMRYAVDDISALSAAISEGGIPLQQIVAAQLTESGQYIRRERSFEGASVDVAPAKADMKAAEQSATIMRSILAFDKIKQEALAAVKDAAMGDGEAVGDSGATGEKGANSTNFTSVMHNLIGQSLLAMKADAAVDAAIEAKARGEKPIITLANTMGSFIEQHVTAEGVSIGQEIFLTFKDLYRRYLEKTRTLTKRDARGKIISQRMLTDEELGPEGVAAYNAVLEEIERSNFGDLPISPIDYITSKLNAADISVGEITGRTATVDYSDGVPIYRSRRPSPAANIETMRSFNSGETDVIILNQSGSTGISLHSSSTFADTNKRTMIIVQPELNIDVFMQTLGRVFRTGQVVPPAYKLLTSDLPAEKRPAAVLGKKMAGLNANTTASRKTDTTFQNIPDFLNEYGDLVTAQIMEENPEIHTALGSPLKEGDGGYERDGAVRKVTGRIPMLPLKDQQELYDMIEGEYNDLIAQLEATGTSTLEAKTLQLDAKLISTADLTAAKDVGGTSPFAAESKVGLFDVKSLGKPYTPEQVRKLIEQGKANTPDREEFAKETGSWLDGRLAELKDDNAKTGLKLRVYEQFGRVNTVLDNYEIGSPVLVATKDNTYTGVVVRMEHKGSANPAAPSSWKMTIAIADSARQLVVPFSKIQSSVGLQDALTGIQLGQVVVKGSNKSIDHALEAFSQGQTTTREKRYIAYGNVLAAYSSVGNQGQIVNFEDSDGNTRAGIMFKKNATLGEIVGSADVSVPDYESMVKFFDRTDDNGMLKSADKNLRITRQGGYWTFMTASSKAKGAQFFLNGKLIEAAGRDFVKSGNSMKLTTRPEVAAKMIDVLRQQGFGIVAGSHITEAREVMGLAKKGEEKAAPQYQAKQGATSTPSPVDLRAAFPWADSIEEVNGKTVMTKGKVSFTIEQVETISPNEVAFRASYGRNRGASEQIAGEFLPGNATIRLSKVADQWTVQHEYEHFLEDMGLITPFERGVLDAAIKRDEKAGTLKFNPGVGKDRMKPAELRAYYVQHELAARDFQRKTTLGRVLQKVADFIDALANLFVRTSKGVVRDVASGKMMGRPTAEQRKFMLPMLQAAYHGTPYRGIEKFLLDKIGTGEGNQAFGWGLYFSNKKEIADWYKDNLGDRTLVDNNGREFAPGDPLYSEAQGAGLKRKAPGQTYKVDLPDDTDMLHWDKTLESQPAGPKKALTTAISTIRAMGGEIADNPKGNEIYFALEKALGSDKAASESLNALGVVGIKYLDGISRGAGDGTYNFVIFDENAIEILETYYQVAKSVDATETSAFKKWFGKSKVVDKDGRPLVVYHGTKADFDTFDSEKSGMSTGHKTAKMGFFFSAEGGVADLFAGEKWTGWPLKRGFADGANLMPVYLSIKNPAKISAKDFLNRFVRGSESSTEYIETLKKSGHDGVVIAGDRHMAEVMGGEEYSADAYVAFEPTQIKSATGNSGAFDPADPRIQYALAPTLQKAKELISDIMHRPEVFGRFNWINTQLHKALRNPAFKRIFDRFHAAAGTQSRSAARAAGLAKDILPDYAGNAAQTARKLFSKTTEFSREDMRSVSKIMSMETLAGKTASPFAGHRLTEDELASLERGETIQLGGNDITMAGKQAKLYRQARAALDQMLNEMATSEAWKAMRGVLPKELHDYWEVFANNPVEVQTAMNQMLDAEMGHATDRAAQAEQAAISFASATDMDGFKEYGKRLTKLNLAIDNKDKFSKKQLEDGDLDEIIANREEKIEKLSDELGISADEAEESLAEYKRLLKEDADAKQHVENVNGVMAQVKDVFDKSQKLIKAGYAPLSRFGRYRVDVHNDEGKLIHATFYDTATDAARARRDLQGRFAGYPDGATVGEVVPISQEDWKLYQGANPEALRLFAQKAGADSDTAVQAYYLDALSSRSSLKHLINRQGYAGYSDDLQRILASFVTSGAKRVSTNYHSAEIFEMVSDKTLPNDLRDEASKLKQFVDNPGDGGSGFRAFAANWYMLGSFMSAAWNGTQVISSTLPELYKHSGSVTRSAKDIGKAYKSIFRSKPDYTASEWDALQKAMEDGTVDAAEVHHLYAQAAKRFIARLGDGVVADKAGAILRLWGMPFAWFETVNRKASFLAAYRMGEAQGMDVDDAYAFAKQIVDITQGIYSKHNRPNVARSAAGGAILTFMQYRIMTLEQISRNMKEGGQARKAAALQLAIIMAMGGWAALPLAEDFMDILDAIMQVIGGKAWLTKKKVREAIEKGGKQAAGLLLEKQAADAVGQVMADFVNLGIVSTLGPVNTQGRAGFGNVVPLVKLLKPSTQYRDSEVFDALGVPGSMAQSLMDASGMLLQGDVGRAAMRLAPNALAAMAKGVDIAATGEMANTRGKKITDGNPLDAAVQFVGGQPSKKAAIGNRLRENQELKYLTQQEERSIVNEWADAYEQKGVVAQAAALKAARERIVKWNKTNPDWPIVVKQSQVMRELQNRKKTTVELATKTAPKELRKSMAVQ